MSDFVVFLKKKKATITTAFLVLLALLSSAGTGLQNFTAIIESLIGSAYLATGNAWFWSAIVGGICSTVVNFCLNIKLLEDFYERISGRKSRVPYLPDNWKKFEYGLGVVVFVVTGILFGMTAFSVGTTGALAVAAIAAGAFVAGVTIPQELEIWLESYDDPVAVAIGRRIYDIKNLEGNKGIDKLLNDLKTDIENAVLKKELKKLRERLAEEAETVSEKKREVEFIDDLIFYLEKFGLDELIRRYSEHSERTQFLSAELTRIKTIIEEEQEKIEGLKIKFREDQNKKALIDVLESLKKAAEKEQPKTSLIDGIKIWWRDLTPGRFVGLIISVGNVLALSLLFTIGLTTFLTGVGVAAFPALIIGFSVAFTFGAFTEFYFYHYFLADFCDRIADKWDELMASRNWGLGIATVVTNAVVNGVLAYFGVILLESLLVAAGIAAPPLLILAIVSAVFAGVASLLLGSNFWIERAEKLFNWGSTKEPAEENMVEDTSNKKPLINEEENVVATTSQATWDKIFFSLREKRQDVTTLNGHKYMVV